jgi:hypothetical protein
MDTDRPAWMDTYRSAWTVAVVTTDAVVATDATLFRRADGIRFVLQKRRKVT